jgi:four helix bundle protein
MRDLSRIEVLAIAKDLAEHSYRFSKRLPPQERYGMISQITRSSVSIAANIAEGFGRGPEGDLERHLRIALGSAAELSILIELAERVHGIEYPEREHLAERLDAVRRKLNRLTTKVTQSRRIAKSE